MHRRQFLQTSAVLAAATWPAVGHAEAASVGGLIDTNVWLGEWPVRRSWAHTPRQLVDKLRQQGVTSAWAGCFEGALHTDLGGLNQGLAESCARDGYGLLVPMGTINPLFPDWEEEVRRCHEIHRMPGIRVFPNYHGYTLDDGRFARLLALATQRGLLVQIAATMEDDRSQSPMFSGAPVQLAPLGDLMEKNRAARVMVLNATSRTLGASNALAKRLSASRVFFEIATLEGAAGIENLLKTIPGLRLTFGSHTPYFYFESALLKLQESALTPAQLAGICSGHARIALTPSP